MPTWRDKVLDSDAGKGSPESARRLVEEVEGGAGNVVLPFLPQPFPSLSSTSSEEEK